MTSIDKLLTFSIVILAFISCQTRQEFDQKKWNENNMDIYPHRNSMLKDLLTNYQLKGLTYRQLTTLLGQPESYSGTEPNTVYYNIVTDYGHDIDPVYVKHLVIVINADSIVAGHNIIEVKH